MSNFHNTSPGVLIPVCVWLWGTFCWNNASITDALLVDLQRNSSHSGCSRKRLFSSLLHKDLLGQRLHPIHQHSSSHKELLLVIHQIPGQCRTEFISLHQQCNSALVTHQIPEQQKTDFISLHHHCNSALVTLKQQNSKQTIVTQTNL